MHRDAGVATEPGDGTVSGEDVRDGVPESPARNWHVGADTEVVDIVEAVSLAEDPMHLISEVVELEAEVEVSEVVLLGSCH